MLQETCDLAVEFLQDLPLRPVTRPVDLAALLAAMGGALPDASSEPLEVIQHFATVVEPGLVASAGPRYFGFVTGGSLPVTVAAEWLATAWDQNAFCYVSSPAAAAAEEVAGKWLLELFGLSGQMSVGFTTGATMSNFAALAAARHALFQRLGWNVEEQGLAGAPEITIVASEESHVAVFAALQMLGLGRNRARRVAADGQGRMRPDSLRSLLAGVTAPVLVCAQAGNVNTGAFDPIDEIAACLRDRPAWLHVDGAFGLWAAASPQRSALVKGVELADSIALDCHKWLNVPYDSGVVFVRNREAHHAAMTLNAPYYVPGPDVARENHHWVPEASRRARGFAVYAALRTLGRRGIAEMVDRCCALARRMADRLTQGPGIEILNDVVLNQVLVRFVPGDGGDADALTAEVIRRVQEEGTCWASGTSWHGMRAMRISVSNWSTTEKDIDLSADAMLLCAAAARSSNLVAASNR